MRQFDHYEFTGILAPGVALLTGLAIVFPNVYALDSFKDVSVGGLGLFVVLAYVAGHLIQAVGNVLENIWWRAWGGMPSDWIRSKPNALLATEQVKALAAHAKRLLGLADLDIGELTSKQWYAVTRQAHAAIVSAGRAGRVETFNGNYGLNRGLAAALFVVSLVSLAVQPARCEVAAVGFVVGCLALYRMHRFARHYARELFVQFLQLPVTDSTKGKK